MKKLFYLTIFTFIFGLSASAQLTLPRASQRQELTQTVGDTKVSIVYHRPNANGRTLWGCTAKNVVPKTNYEEPCIVPYGQVWRTGANETTAFEVSDDVLVEGKKLAKGRYALFTIPGEKEWIVIFNKTIAWGEYSYKEAEDVLRVTVPSKPSAAFNERFTINISDQGVVSLLWDNLQVDFKVQ